MIVAKSLRSVLTVRKHTEDLAAVGLGEAQRNMDIASTKLAAIVEREQISRSEAATVTDFRVRMLYDDYARRLEGDRALAASVLHAFVVAHDAALQRYMEARQQRMLLEKVIERRASEAHAARVASEIREQDDIRTRSVLI
jgi:flagellar export protein FliJ